MNPEEQVLVITRTLFTEQNPFDGFQSLEGRDDLGIYLQGAPSKNAFFMPRGEAEESPFHLQIIPYIILLSEDNVFLYRRGEVGSEPRLHGKYSIGIGGHINAEDAPDGEPFTAFLNAVSREAKEEVGITLSVSDLDHTAIGLVHDEGTPVDRVHLGVVLVFKLGAASAEAVLKACENTMLEPQWIPLYELENPALVRGFESWSGHVAKHLISNACADAKWACPAFRERVGMLAVSSATLSAAASGFLLQESPRSHMISKKMVEEAAGETQCMLAGLVAHEDVEGHKVKKAAKEFHAELGDIVKHQKVTIKDIIEPLP